jgi:putative ABC transport system permease protein
MALVLLLARRSLAAHPARALFSVLGVAVGIATGVAVFTLDHVTVLSRTARLEPGWGADLEVRASHELADPKRALLALEGVAGVAAFFQNDVRLRPVRSSGGDDPAAHERARARLVALEEGSGPSLGVYHVEEGRDLGAEDARGLLIGRALAEQLGLAVGDELLLSPPERAAQAECIEGVLRRGVAPAAREEAFRVQGMLSPEGIGRRSQGEVVVIGYQAGRALFADVFVESQFWLKRSEAVDLEELEARLAQGFTFERNQARAVGQMADERAFRNGVRVAGLLALLLGLFVIFHTLSMSLVERVREVGSLFALSASRTQIAFVFLAEALVIALVAGVLGLAGGLALAAALLRLGITTLGMQYHRVPFAEVPWPAALGLTALGVAIALSGSVYPILRVRGTDVVAALRGDEPGRRTLRHSFHLFSTLLLVAVVPLAFFQVVPVVGAADPVLLATLVLGLIVLGLVVGVPLFVPGLVSAGTVRLARLLEPRFPLVGRLAATSLRQSPGRIGASISAVALVAAAFVGLKGMTRSLAAETEVWGRVALADRVLVEGLPDVELEPLARALHEQPEVLGVESGDARAFPGFLLLGLAPEELARHGPLAAEPELLRRLHEQQGIVLSERLARQRDLQPGDQVLINTSGHGVQAFTVLCASDAYGYFFHPDERAYGVIHQHLLKRFFCVDVEKTSVLAVKLAPGADRGIVEAVLRARYPQANPKVYDGPGLMWIMLRDLTTDFVLFDIILFLTALLAALGVLNGQLLAAIERRKELGVLQALGTTRGQLAGIVLVESLVVGGVGGALGCLVGVGLTPVLVSALRLLSGLELPLRTGGPWLAFALLGAMLLTVLAALYPVWRANRMDAVRAVRTG